MSDVSASPWPEYHIGTTEHIHAVGVLIANWNQIETAYQAFFQLIFPAHCGSGIRAFQLLSNEQRVRLIRDELIAKLSGNEADWIDYFLKCANICYANRNVFAHAHAHPTPSEDKFRISKGTGRDNVGAQYLFKLEDIRSMADEAHETFLFGIKTFAYFQSRATIAHSLAGGQDASWVPQMPLPQKLSLPRSWDQIREIPTPPPPPPPPSGA